MPDQRTTDLLLVKSKLSSNEIAISSSRAPDALSVVDAVKMLHCVREIALATSDDFTQTQTDCWIFTLQQYPAALIERAGYEYVKRSKQMPKLSEIVEILDGMIKVERQNASAEKTKKYQAELEDNRRKLQEAGLPSGMEQFAQLMKMAQETANKFPS